MYPQLPSASGNVFLYPQPEDAGTRGPLDVLYEVPHKCAVIGELCYLPNTEKRKAVNVVNHMFPVSSVDFSFK
jgi:hypothetical protein